MAGASLSPRKTASACMWDYGSRTAPGAPPPPLWNEFDSLVRVPMLVIRGANSDILSAATVETMAAHHPGMQSIEVPDQGHVPALEGGLIATVAQFVAACDGAASHQ
jgi:pimeloyl-ACP methyl ester carboxylesterase